MSEQPRSNVRAIAFAALLCLGVAGATNAQTATLLPRNQSDALIEAGRWTEAEEMLYGEVRLQPRDPMARARLGRYLAMKGALLPGLVLIEEAQQFGLPAATARGLAAPFRSLLDLRRRESAGARDSSLVVRAPASAGSLLRFPVVRASRHDTVWADLVPRMIGLDSASGTSPRVGIEVLEGLVPTYDVTNRVLRLHADSRSALSAVGRRYPVLRSPADVRVLLAPGRVRSLPEALAELDARWWQLDLLHGLLVVR
ncbi:MAG TPA: hypothetical protein VGP25_09610 [Gemmatimonadaceae bacterium]|jgi:hypothetical protein|nr:hypothetical protein [Gemmatimonadaceae bacterium]